MNYQDYFNQQMIFNYPPFSTIDDPSTLYGDCYTLSEASVSSMEIHTPDTHPIPDINHEWVAQNIANDTFGYTYSPTMYVPPPSLVYPNQPYTFMHEMDCNLSQSCSSEEDHLSKKELIQRVLELEKEKQSTFNSDIHYFCCWVGCKTMTHSLHQLTTHIRDTHIGSGKPAYYCEWAACPRKGKPFTKRHKMQNHIRTHTGERPFECRVKGCDKRFSRLDSLNTHVKTHSNIRPYACPVANCSKAYFHSRSLRKHEKSHEICTLSLSD